MIYCCNAISDRDLYNINAPGSTILQRGNDNSKLVSLQHPINFYTEKYDSIYVSLNAKKIAILKIYFIPSFFDKFPLRTTQDVI